MRVTVGETALCGVKFFQSISSNNDIKNYAFNTNMGYDVSVVFRNESARNGISYDIPAIKKLSLNNMKVGGDSVCISDYSISCDTSGIKVKSGSRGLGALKYFNISSDTGVLLNNQSSVEASTNAVHDYTYNVDLEKYGLKKGDILSGQLYIEIAESDRLTAFDNTLAEPLAEAEEHALRALGVIK